MKSLLQLKTDQRSCYNESGHEIPCAGSGQDGQSSGPRQPSATRFEARDDLVVDRVTDLVWTHTASPATFPMSWPEAFEYVDHLNRSSHCGIDNWRLPSRRELFSLVSHRCINPALPEGHPFTEVFPGYYWTASPCRRLADQAWYIHFGGGRIYRGMKANSYMVWPVAGSQPDEQLPPNRFVTSQQRTAQDRLTNRVWLKPQGSVQRTVSWEKALAAIDVLNAQKEGGHADWRLPNIRELESLVDLNRHSPALPADHPFEDIAEGYWSATTSAYEKRYAWVLYPRDGAVGVGYKRLTDFCVWAIRRDMPQAVST